MPPALTLPVPPSINRYWRIFRNRVVKTSEAKSYNKTAAWEAKSQGGSLLTGPVSVSLSIYRPQKRGDIDNYLKVLLDSMNGVLWGDDSQIVELFVKRFDDKKNPRIEMQVEEYEEKTKL